MVRPSPLCVHPQVYCVEKAGLAHYQSPSFNHYLGRQGRWELLGLALTFRGQERLAIIDMLPLLLLLS